MTNEVLGKCPVCAKDMRVTTLHCPHCSITITGDFYLNKFSKLSQEQLQFIDVFIKSRGNIKEIERELGISYPTVRSKLENVIQALGHHTPPAPNNKKEILERLSQGEITPEEAVQLLKK